MAKKSKIAKNKKRAALIAKYMDVRTELRNAIKDPSLPMDEKFQLIMKLSRLPRDSSPVRYVKRDELDGRPRGKIFFKKFHLSRVNLRRLAQEGLIPGLVKSC